MPAAPPSTVETPKSKRCFNSSATRSAALVQGKPSAQQTLPAKERLSLASSAYFPGSR